MSYERSENGTLVVGGLLLLALAFAGYWIDEYGTTTHDIWPAALPFGFAAMGIILLGIGNYLWRGGAKKRPG